MSTKLSGLMDAAAWFDILSIGEIKIIRLESAEKREKATQAVEELYKCLEKQLGPRKLQEVYESKEYCDLFKVNEETFDAVELAEMNIDKITAYEVAQLNNRRYICKKIIQKKFFDDDLDEVKSGV